MPSFLNPSSDFLLTHPLDLLLTHPLDLLLSHLLDLMITHLPGIGDHNRRSVSQSKPRLHVEASRRATRLRQDGRAH